jgi:hypothetical protein
MVDTAEGSRLADAVIQCDVAWREESDALSAGHESWSSGAVEDRTIQFAVYNMAVDSEECATRLLRGKHRSTRSQKIFARERSAVPWFRPLGDRRPARGIKTGRRLIEERHRWSRQQGAAPIVGEQREGNASVERRSNHTSTKQIRPPLSLTPPEPSPFRKQATSSTARAIASGC